MVPDTTSMNSSQTNSLTNHSLTIPSNDHYTCQWISLYLI